MTILLGSAGGVRRAVCATLLMASVSVSVSVSAATSPQMQSAEKLFAGADRQAGRALHQTKQCAACHAQRLGGDGSSMYTRLERKVTTPQKLMGQIAACNTQLGAAMFPDDERDVAAFLNHDYYHFK